MPSFLACAASTLGVQWFAGRFAYSRASSTPAAMAWPRRTPACTAFASAFAAEDRDDLQRRRRAGARLGVTVQVGGVGRRRDERFGMRFAELVGSGQADADVARAAALDLRERLRDRRLERLRSGTAGDRDDQARRFQARGAMDIERLALLQLQVAVLDRVGHQVRDRGVERGIEGFAGDHQDECVEAQIGERGG